MCVCVCVCVCFFVAFYLNLSGKSNHNYHWFLCLRGGCFLFVWISGVSVLLPKLILLTDNISATWANEQISNRVGIWSFYKYSNCVPSVPPLVISVTTKLKLGFEGENVIAG